MIEILFKFIGGLLFLGLGFIFVKLFKEWLKDLESGDNE